MVVRLRGVVGTVGRGGYAGYACPCIGRIQKKPKISQWELKWMVSLFRGTILVSLFFFHTFFRDSWAT